MDKEFLKWLDNEGRAAMEDRQDASEENKQFYQGKEAALEMVANRLKAQLWAEAME